MANHKKNRQGKKHKHQIKELKEKTSVPEQTPPNTQSPPGKRRLLSSLNLKKLGTFILTLLGLAFSIYSLYPRVSILETTLLNAGNPFYFPFIVKNSGNTSLKDFSYHLGIEKIVYAGGSNIKGISIVRVIDSDSSTRTIRDTIPKIKKDGTHPINLSTFIGGNTTIDSAQIFIKFKYYIPVINIPFRDSTKFVLFKDSFDEYKWKEYQF